MLGSLHRITRLRPRDIFQIGVLSTLLLGIEIGLRLTRLDRLSRVLGIGFLKIDDSEHWATFEPLNQTERRWTDNASRLLRRWPLDATCLRRSLMLGWILRRRSPVLVLGVTRSHGAVSAHAWIRVGATDLDPTASTYLPFRFDSVKTDAE